PRAILDEEVGNGGGFAVVDEPGVAVHETFALPLGLHRVRLPDHDDERRPLRMRPDPPAATIPTASNPGARRDAARGPACLHRVRNGGNWLRRPLAPTWKRATGPVTPRNTYEPRAVNRTPIGADALTASRVLAETTIWPPWPRAQIRDV